MSVIFKRLEESVVVEGDAANQCGGDHIRCIDRRQRKGLDEEAVAIEERGENSSKVPKDRDKETSTCIAQEESLQQHDQGIALPQLQQQQQYQKNDLKTEFEREAYEEDEPLEEAPGLSHSQLDQQQQSCLYKIKHRIPHLYYITTHLLLPLMTLIGMAFLFGGILAKIEMKEEILRNDAAAADIFVKYVDHIADRQTIHRSIANISVQCLASSHAGNNIEDLWEGGAGMSPQQEKREQDVTTYNNMTTCAARKAQERFPITDILLFLVRSETPLTFNWMKCYDNNTIGDANKTSLFLKRFGLNEYGRYDQQLALYLHRFGTNWYKLKNESGIPNEQIFANQQLMSELVGKTTGSAGCQVHWAGGALFWFTVMTTIGYGNAAPTTDEGRLLVYTAGFVTIILFLVLNNTAAYFWKHIFEHFFLKCNLTFLVRTGPLSVLFWLSMTFLWMLVVAFGAVAYEKNVGRETFTLKDAYWFSYITITTVGFGDIHAEHEDFGVLDMFHFPLLVLVGFNFLGIFAEKAVDLYNHHFPEDRGYPDILEERRRSAAAGKTNKQQQETAPSPDAQLLGVTTIMEC